MSLPYRQDLTGKKFNRLLVLGFDEEYTKAKKAKGATRSYWKCQCDCGNIISVSISALKDGRTKSCGCLQKEKASKFMREVVQPISAKIKIDDLTGQQFGRLKVIKRDNEKKDNRPWWICQCSCGNLISVRSQSLKRGATKSCGCLGNSEGNAIIEKILKENNANYKKEISFPDLIDQSYLRYDFGLYNKNGELLELIEYDGRQHSDETSIWHTDTVIKHDQMKTEYAKKHNIPLLRIDYRDKDKINMLYLLQPLLKK